MQNIGRAFSYMFEDKDWLQKILIGAVMILFAIFVAPLFLLLGYMLEVAGNAYEGKEIPLPKWEDWGDRFIKGVMFFIVILIYAIPLTILHFLLSLIPCIGFILSIGLSFVLTMALPFITVRFARSGNINDALDIKGLMEFIQNNISSLAIVALFTWLLGFLAVFGLLAFGIGILFTYFWANLASYYLFGRVYREIELAGKTAQVATEETTSDTGEEGGTVE